MKKRECNYFFILNKNKKGESILKESVMFLILNLIYFSILISFLISQGNGVIVLEQAYAKNIAILIDASKPVMEMTLDMSEAFDLAEKNGLNPKEIVKINENTVAVKLSKDSGYSYSFFNNVEVSAYPSIGKNYTIIVNRYK